MKPAVGLRYGKALTGFACRSTHPTPFLAKSYRRRHGGAMTNNESDNRKRHNRPQKAEPEHIPNIMARDALPHVVCAQHRRRNQICTVLRGACAVLVGSLRFCFRSVGSMIEDSAEIGKAPHRRVAHIDPLGYARPNLTFLSFSIAIRR